MDAFGLLAATEQHEDLVRLDCRANGMPLYVMIRFITAEAELTRITELQTPSLSTATAEASVVKWPRASMAEAPTLFCMDANWAPDRSESETIWRMLCSFMLSVWDQYFDECSKRLVECVVVTSKVRGSESTQLKKIGEHVCLVRGLDRTRACGSLLPASHLPTSPSLRSCPLQLVLFALLLAKPGTSIGTASCLTTHSLPLHSVPRAPC